MFVRFGCRGGLAVTAMKLTVMECVLFGVKLATFACIINEMLLNKLVGIN